MKVPYSGVAATLAAAAIAVFYGVSYSGIYTERTSSGPSFRVDREERSPRLDHPEGALGGGSARSVRVRNRRTARFTNTIGLPSSAGMSELLAEADYVTQYSNRLYGTVSRLPDRYPVSREYYRQLFSGELGYTLDAHFTSYPNLLGVGFVDETFERPDSAASRETCLRRRPYPVSIKPRAMPTRASRSTTIPRCWSFAT